jgi:glycosyltransferase involved in cell wall biosynthesis
MKIAFMGIKGLPSKGGAERVVEAIVQRLSGDHTLTVYCSRHYTAPEAFIPGVRLIRLPCLTGKYSHMTSLDLLVAWHALLLGDYDLIHLHNIEASFVLPVLRIKYKVISTAHGRHYLSSKVNLHNNSNKWGRFSTALMSLMEFPFARMSNALTSVSQDDAVDLGARFHKSVAYIPNGVDREPQVDLDSARSILEEYHITAGSFIIFAAGRMIPLKGTHLLLEALEGFGYNVRLLLVGDLTHSADYAQELRILSDERVFYIPFLTERAILLGLLQLSCLFVFPSTREAMSTMLLEAASLGVPILCSNIPGNVAVLPDQALHFSSGDMNDLREKLAWALDHPQEMKALGLKAQAHVQLNFSWDQIVKQYHTLYQEVTGHA